MPAPTWHDEGLELTVAVNLSMQNLLDLHLPDDVLRLLREWNLDPKWLELEITEGVIMSEPRRAKAVLGRLAEMGIRWRSTTSAPATPRSPTCSSCP